MNKYVDRIVKDFEDNLEVNKKSRELIEMVLRAGDEVIKCFQSGGKLLSAGNGGSSGDAQHIASEFVNRFERDRRPLPAISLVSDNAVMTSIANDFHYDEVFSKQILAFGKSGDVLMLFTTSGNSSNLLTAYSAGVAQGMKVIVFSGKDGGKLGQMLGSSDIEIRIPSSRTARVQEMHLFFIHAICDYVDEKMVFGS